VKMFDASLRTKNAKDTLDADQTNRMKLTTELTNNNKTESRERR
jgi:hypothetical protein